MFLYYNHDNTKVFFCKLEIGFLIIGGGEGVKNAEI